MKEKYQLDNPNNCRIFIDYRKDKDKVRFDYVANDSIFSIAKNSYFLLLFKTPFNMLFLTLILLMFLMKNIWFILIFAVFYSSIVYIIPLLTIKSKRLQRILPAINAIGYKKFIVDFKPEDIKENKIEIPLFRNVMLDYKATKGMSKYLERVEITEHEFNLLIKHKKEKNQYLWKAIFYFSKKPSIGELKVAFY